VLGVVGVLGLGVLGLGVLGVLKEQNQNLWNPGNLENL